VADDFLDSADAVVIIVFGSEDVAFFAGLGIGGEGSHEAAEAVVGEVLDEGAEDGLAVEGRDLLVDLQEAVPGVVVVGVGSVGGEVAVGVVGELLWQIGLAGGRVEGRALEDGVVEAMDVGELRDGRAADECSASPVGGLGEVWPAGVAAVPVAQGVESPGVLALGVGDFAAGVGKGDWPDVGADELVEAVVVVEGGTRGREPRRVGVLLEELCGGAIA
jgi:hypothetical protein